MLRTRPAREPGSPPVAPLTAGVTVMIISKPVSPSAICGKVQSPTPSHVHNQTDAWSPAWLVVFSTRKGASRHPCQVAGCCAK